MARRGIFIVLEGPDKSGKSTQARFLARSLRARGREVLHTREPGGTPFAEAIRRILLDPKNRLHPLAELLLYEASRAQHTWEVILPALRRGAVVLCERYTMATLAYQGYGRGLSLPMIRSLNRMASARLEPDLTVVLDMPERDFSRRDATRRHDRLERESSLFRSKVARAYRRLARTEPRARLVDTSGGIPAARRRIESLVQNLLSRRK